MTSKEMFSNLYDKYGEDFNWTRFRSHRQADHLLLN